jgi:hypothetical protein
MGLDGPYPPDVKPPVLDPSRPKLVLTKFPAQYVTPFHHRMRRLWRRKQDGYPPRTDGSLHWPAVMLQSFQLLDHETSRRDNSRGSR